MEGPYGQFKFDTPKQRQIWVAGGIGIVPFVARIKALIDTPEDRDIDFFYSASATDGDQFINRITAASKEAKIRIQ